MTGQLIDLRKSSLLCALLVSAPAWATVPYGSVAPGTPSIGPGIAPPSLVPGKEYSHDRDHMITAVGTAPDPGQIVAWDGSGGVANGLDYSFSRLLWTIDQDIDATANHIDFLFNQLRMDDAHLIFSVDDMYVLYSAGVPGPALLPSAGPVPLGNGNTIGGAGEYSYELGVVGGANLPDMQGVWATQPMINAMPFPDDVDGLELWGPEPALTGDTDKYSLDTDILSFGAVIPGDAVSVWNGSGTPYISHSAIVSAVTSLLGPVPPSAINLTPDGPFEGRDGVNLDALMVQDLVGSPDSFDRDPTGGDTFGDLIIFSIEQMADPVDPDGYYATGSELFVLDAAGGVTFLAHGGHLWDHAYALATFDVWAGHTNNRGVLDINAIEAVTQGVVPEPGSIALLGLGALTLIRRRR